MGKINICKSGNIPFTTHKYWELQITTLFEGPYFNFSFDWTRKQDHAGMTLTFECMNFMFVWKVFYDARHWDWDTNEYEKIDISE